MRVERRLQRMHCFCAALLLAGVSLLSGCADRSGLKVQDHSDAATIPTQKESAADTALQFCADGVGYGALFRSYTGDWDGDAITDKINILNAENYADGGFRIQYLRNNEYTEDIRQVLCPGYGISDIQVLSDSLLVILRKRYEEFEATSAYHNANFAVYQVFYDKTAAQPSALKLEPAEYELQMLDNWRAAVRCDGEEYPFDIARYRNFYQNYNIYTENGSLTAFAQKLAVDKDRGGFSEVDTCGNQLTLTQHIYGYGQYDNLADIILQYTYKNGALVLHSRTVQAPNSKTFHSLEERFAFAEGIRWNGDFVLMESDAAAHINVYSCGDITVTSRLTEAAEGQHALMHFTVQKEEKRLELRARPGMNALRNADAALDGTTVYDDGVMLYLADFTGSGSPQLVITYGFILGMGSAEYAFHLIDLEHMTEIPVFAKDNVDAVSYGSQKLTDKQSEMLLEKISQLAKEDTGLAWWENRNGDIPEILQPIGALTDDYQDILLLKCGFYKKNNHMVPDGIFYATLKYTEEGLVIDEVQYAPKKENAVQQ